jgi:Zn-dependent protease
VVLFALTIHEFMHGYVAWRCGDDTALRAGRLTLNPLPHLDLVGTLCLLFGPIGWAKPVPVQPLNFRRPRRDDILVSGAGVAANFALAVALSLALRAVLWFGVWPEGGPGAIALEMVLVGAVVNFALAVFNLLPIPPLDGSHLVRDLLPARAAAAFASIGRYGFIFLVAAVLLNRETGWLSWPVWRLVEVFAGVDLGH